MLALLDAAVAESAAEVALAAAWFLDVRDADALKAALDAFRDAVSA